MISVFLLAKRFPQRFPTKIPSFFLPFYLFEIETVLLFLPLVWRPKNHLVFQSGSIGHKPHVLDDKEISFFATLVTKAKADYDELFKPNILLKKFGKS